MGDSSKRKNLYQILAFAGLLFGVTTMFPNQALAVDRVAEAGDIVCAAGESGHHFLVLANDNSRGCNSYRIVIDDYPYEPVEVGACGDFSLISLLFCSAAPATTGSALKVLTDDDFFSLTCGTVQENNDDEAEILYVTESASINDYLVYY